MTSAIRTIIAAGFITLAAGSASARAQALPGPAAQGGFIVTIVRNTAGTCGAYVDPAADVPQRLSQLRADVTVVGRYGPYQTTIHAHQALMQAGWTIVLIGPPNYTASTC